MRARSPVRTLFWRLFAINGLLFATGTALLAVTPATVSSPVVATELLVLLVGLALILGANALLLRASLRREAEHDAGAAHALAAQEGERERIARELHDEIGQGLTVALLSLRRVADHAPLALCDELANAQDAVRLSLENVRHVAQRLRPGVLADLGLRSALTSLATELAGSGGVAVERAVDARLPELSEEVELVVFRVAQEALTNVARHSGATHVQLALSATDAGLVLRVRDDGRGGVLREGAGIRGMRERARLVGAELTVVPAASGGTEVRLHVPLAARG